MLRTAIYGMGRWGQTLVNAVQDDSKKIRFTAGVARDPSKYSDFAKEKGFPVYADYAQVLADPEIDAVALATPHSMHAENVQQAAAAGKHVFCEKPFTLTEESARASVAACEKAGVVLAVAFNRRLPTRLYRIEKTDRRWPYRQGRAYRGTAFGPRGVPRPARRVARFQGGEPGRRHVRARPARP